MSLAMSKLERETFLAGVHVAIIGIPEPEHGPLTVPIWYRYTPGGEVQVWTGAESRKIKLLSKAGRFSLCVQDERPPYRYVSVEGPVISIDPIDFERDLRPMVYRYLGAEEGERYIAQIGGEKAGADDVLVRMWPERWRSEDFAKQPKR